MRGEGEREGGRDGGRGGKRGRGREREIENSELTVHEDVEQRAGRQRELLEGVARVHQHVGADVDDGIAARVHDARRRRELQQQVEQGERVGPVVKPTPDAAQGVDVEHDRAARRRVVARQKERAELRLQLQQPAVLHRAHAVAGRHRAQATHLEGEQREVDEVLGSGEVTHGLDLLCDDPHAIQQAVGQLALET